MLTEKPRWVNLVIGLFAVIASFFWQDVVTTNPPFDSQTWIDIVTWIVNLGLMSLVGYNANAWRVKTKGTYHALDDLPPWFNIVLGAVGLIAAFFWPSLVPSGPPFDSSVFVKIVEWIVTLIFTAAFGWNVKTYNAKKSL